MRVFFFSARLVEMHLIERVVERNVLTWGVCVFFFVKCVCGGGGAGGRGRGWSGGGEGGVGRLGSSRGEGCQEAGG